MLEETHYYPFGLTMAGISSKALKTNYPENHKKFNGIEHTPDFDMNTYDAFYRTLDPQIGRFLQIDPKIESAEAWSPYTAMLNNPLRYSDPLGDSAIKPKAPDRQLSPEETKRILQRILIEPNKDGDQTGTVKNATEDDYKMDYWGAVRRDFVHSVAEVLGFNAVDDASANAMNPNVSTSDKIAGILIAGLSIPGKGKGGERPIHSVYPEGMLVFEGEQPPRLGEPKATEGAVGAHTQLRWDTKNQRVYQAREFNAQGNPVRDIDFTHSNISKWDASSWSYGAGTT